MAPRNSSQSYERVNRAPFLHNFQFSGVLALGLRDFEFRQKQRPWFIYSRIYRKPGDVPRMSPDDHRTRGNAVGIKSERTYACILA